MIYGYNQKILHVNLSSRSIRVEEPEENFYRQYIGNGILAAYYLLTETEAGMDPLSPDNLLMFLSSVIAGQDAPGLARFVISGKSPLTGGIGEARSEGPFGRALKQSGYDGIVIRGASKTPVILVIEDGQVKIEDASHLWGKSVGDTTDTIQKQYTKSSVATIGIAGENLVRFANVISDRCHQASRSGMGALMGSKKLKAVVIKGGSLPKVAHPQKAEKLYSWFDQKMRTNELSMWQYNPPGFGAWIHTHGIDASLGVHNYQTAICDHTDNYADEIFLKYLKGESPCPGCPNQCIKTYAVNDTEQKSGGLHQEIAGAIGPNAGVRKVETVIQANILCNQLGMDPNSLGYTISFAQECIERNLLDSEELQLFFQNPADLLKLIERIAKREGIGDLLAEGSARAARQLGGNAPKYALTVKDNEIVPFEPRSQTNLALGYALSPTGPRFEICEHDWDFDTKYGWKHSLDYCRTIGILERIPMEYVGRDKVRNFKALNTLWSAADAFGICLFASAPTRVYSLEEMAHLVHAITGWETSSYEIMRKGEMRNHLFRFYNNREGFTAKDDTLPDRFFEEAIDFGPYKGVKLDRERFQDALTFYYQMMGWNEAGEPLPATLYDYGLDWLASIAAPQPIF